MFDVKQIEKLLGTNKGNVSIKTGTITSLNPEENNAMIAVGDRDSISARLNPQSLVTIGDKVTVMGDNNSWVIVSKVDFDSVYSNNLISNGDFELNRNGWRASYNCDLSLSDKEINSGIKSLQVRPNDYGQQFFTFEYIENDTRIKPESVYQLQFYSFIENSSASFDITCVWLDGEGRELGESEQEDLNIAEINDWGRLITDFKSPRKATRYKLKFKVSYDDEVVLYLDDIGLFGHGNKNPKENDLAAINKTLNADVESVDGSLPANFSVDNEDAGTLNDTYESTGGNIGSRCMKLDCTEKTGNRIELRAVYVNVVENIPMTGSTHVKGKLNNLRVNYMDNSNSVIGYDELELEDNYTDWTRVHTLNRPITEISDFNGNWTNSSDDFINVSHGVQSRKATIDGDVTTAFTRTLNLNSFGITDIVKLRFFVESSDNLSNDLAHFEDTENDYCMALRIKTDASNYFVKYIQRSDIVDGWNEIQDQKNNFEEVGAPDWLTITAQEIQTTSSVSVDISFDYWYIERNATTENYNYYPEDTTRANLTVQLFEVGTGYTDAFMLQDGLVMTQWVPNTGGATRAFGYYIDDTLVVEVKAISSISPMSLTVVDVYLSVDTAPTGADLIIDIHKNGTTMFSTQGNRPTISAGSTSSNSVAPDITSIALGDVVTLEIDQIGSTVAGANLAATVRCNP